MDTRKIIKSLNLREDDSKRIDYIVNVLTEHKEYSLMFKDHLIAYDPEYKVFEAFHQDNLGEALQNFRDGREAIDFVMELEVPSEKDEPEVNSPQIEESEKDTKKDASH